MSEPSIPAIRVGSGDHVVLCLHGWFASASGWGPLTAVALATSIEAFIGR